MNLKNHFLFLIILLINQQTTTISNQTIPRRISANQAKNNKDYEFSPLFNWYLYRNKIFNSFNSDYLSEEGKCDLKYLKNKTINNNGNILPLTDEFNQPT